MNFVYFLGWSFYRALYSTYFRWRVFNSERVPLSGPVILASNHASYLDPPLVGSGVNRAINYLARDTLFRYPGMGWLLRQWNSVPVDRDGGGAAGLKAILDRLLAGGAIILFPEGTRTSDGKLQPARSGIGLTVIKSTAAVVPCARFRHLHGEAYGRHLTIPRPAPSCREIWPPHVFRKVACRGAKACTKPRLKQIYQEVANEIMEAIAKLEPFEEVEKFG